MRKGKDYPSSYKIKLFHIKYKNQLSPIAKLILKSFRWKNIYFAIDDIIYLLRSNPIERDQLLAILNSSVLSLIYGFLKFTLTKFQNLINSLIKILKN